MSVCLRCQADPCTCQTEPTKPPPRPWLVTPCATPGCSTMISTLPGITDFPTLCKWCRGQDAYNTRPRSAIQPDDGPLLSKDECGVDLYEAIRLNAARLQAERRGKPEQAKHWASQLPHVLDRQTIIPDDLRRLLAMS
jgi:hypothetical protein